MNQQSTSSQSPTESPEQLPLGGQMLEHVLAELAASEMQLE